MTKKPRFNNTPADAKLPFKKALPAIWPLLFPPKANRPQQPMPAETPDWKTFFLDDGTPRYIWFGHSTLLARICGLTLLFDPVLGPSASNTRFLVKRFQAPPVALASLPPIDICLISHNHFDHLEQSTVAFLSTRTTHFLCPEGLDATLVKWGVSPSRVTPLPYQETYQNSELTITAVPARHNSARSMFDYNQSHWCGWVLTTGCEKIYFSADSAYGPHFAALGRQFGGFDLAFIENGQYDVLWPENHMHPEETAQAAKDVRAKVFVPIHWGMFALARHPWQEPPEKSVPLAESFGITALTPVIGSVFHAQSPSTRWWRGLS